MKVDVSLSDRLLYEIQGRLASMGNIDALPATKAALLQGAHIIQDAWRNWALGAKLGDADTIAGDSKLASSIKIHASSGGAKYTIGTNSPKMARIQEGTSDYDMKKTYPTGPHSRVSKKGRPYLIVPIRHAGSKGAAHIGNAIPKIAAKVIEGRTFRRTLKTGTIHMEANAAGVAVARNNYTRGDSLGLSSILDIKDTSVEGDNTDYGALGMIKAGDKGHPQYVTFRVITKEGSKGDWLRRRLKKTKEATGNSNLGEKYIGGLKDWVRKGKPANDVIGALDAQCSPTIEEIIAAALKADISIG